MSNRSFTCPVEQCGNDSKTKHRYKVSAPPGLKSPLNVIMSNIVTHNDVLSTLAVISARASVPLPSLSGHRDADQCSGSCSCHRLVRVHVGDCSAPRTESYHVVPSSDREAEAAVQGCICRARAKPCLSESGGSGFHYCLAKGGPEKRDNHMGQTCASPFF